MQYTNQMPQPPPQQQAVFGMQAVPQQGGQVRVVGMYAGGGFASNSMRNLTLRTKEARSRPCCIPACSICCALFILLVGLCLKVTGDEHLTLALELSPETEFQYLGAMCQMSLKVDSRDAQVCTQYRSSNNDRSCHAEECCESYETGCKDFSMWYFTWRESFPKKYYATQEEHIRPGPVVSCSSASDYDPANYYSLYTNSSAVECWKPADPSHGKDDMPWQYNCPNDECMKIVNPADEADGAEAEARGLIIAGNIVLGIGCVGCFMGMVIAGSKGNGFRFN
ncbi:hypothetical protein TrVE_jg13232 [Triparma verrucosa]|nr:hypothetical protein TrVE_jg13232 [Triparma verrucosa]